MKSAHSHVPGIIFLSLILAGYLAAQTAVADCATCHRSIADEWKTSLHGEAYTTPLFLAEKEKRSAAGESSCDCHAPQRLAPDRLGKRPAERGNSPQAGVDCISCHLDTEMVIWSSGEGMYVPHWTRQAPVYASGEFCAGCHSWAGPDPADCQECHMRPVAGLSADGPHLESPPGATHRSHRWAASRDPQVLAEAVAFKAVARGPDYTVEVTNLVPTHPFPGTHHRTAMVALVTESRTEPLWRESLSLAADSTATFTVKLPETTGATWFELRFYPAPAIWPDSFYVVQRAGLPAGGH